MSWPEAVVLAVAVIFLGPLVLGIVIVALALLLTALVSGGIVMLMAIQDAWDSVKKWRSGKAVSR